MCFEILRLRLLFIVLFCTCLVGDVHSSVIERFPSDWPLDSINETERPVRTFSLKNDGTNTLRVVELVRTCVCGELSIDRREIPPGGEAYLRLALDPGVLPPGPFVKTFYVRVEELAGARDARPYRRAVSGLAALPQGRIGGALGERALPGRDLAAREDTRPPMDGSAGSVVGVTVRGTVVPEWDVSPARHRHVASGGTAEFVVRPRSVRSVRLAGRRTSRLSNPFQSPAECVSPLWRNVRSCGCRSGGNRRRPRRAARRLRGHASANVPTRVIAVQLCGARRLAAARTALEAILADPNSGTVLKLAARKALARIVAQ